MLLLLLLLLLLFCRCYCCLNPYYYNANKELWRWQPCRHWQHRWLSLWQLPVPSVTTEMTYAFQNIVCNVAAFCSNPNVLTHFSWPRNAITGHGICLTFDPKHKTRTKSYLLHCFLLHIKAVRTHDSQACQAKCIELPVNRYAHSKHT